MKQLTPVGELNQETWKPVVGFEGLYEVSTLGRVKSTRRKGAKGGLRRPNIIVGYPAVDLWKYNQRSTKYVHRLVLEAFIGPCPDGMECRHMDGNRANNCLENLSWGTYSENQQDRVRHGTDQYGEKNRQAKLTTEQVRQIRKASGVQTEIAKAFGINRATVGLIRQRKRWGHI